MEELVENLENSAETPPASEAPEAGLNPSTGHPPETATQLAELDGLIGELKEKVASLREGEFDAAALESRLRELTELAARAASTLESVSR